MAKRKNERDRDMAFKVTLKIMNYIFKLAKFGLLTLFHGIHAPIEL